MPYLPTIQLPAWFQAKIGTHPSQKSQKSLIFWWEPDPYMLIHFGEASSIFKQNAQIKHILYKFQAQDHPQVGRYEILHAMNYT